MWVLPRQGTSVISVGASGDCLEFLSPLSYLLSFSPSLWKTALLLTKIVSERGDKPKLINQPNHEHEKNI